MIHSFLIIGQSNMAGRGYIDEAEPIENDKIYVLRNGRWRQMYVPVNCDRATSGINLVESFADAYAKEHNADVGIIPCADGGSSLDQWIEGGLLFDHAVYLSRLAQRTSTIAGVLWHQGESDCADRLYPLYEKKLLKIISALRKQLDLYDVPFLVGGLGDFLPMSRYCLNGSKQFENYIHINNALKKIDQNDKMVGYVSAKGLTANSEQVHFSAKSLREFGLRYYEEFKKIENKDKVFEEKSCMDSAIRTELELL